MTVSRPRGQPRPLGNPAVGKSQTSTIKGQHVRSGAPPPASRAMITEYPLETGATTNPNTSRSGPRRAARPATEPAHDHATAGQDRRDRRQDAAQRRSRGTKAFYPTLSMCDPISPASERHPRLTLAIVSSSWRGRPTSLHMDYTYREPTAGRFTGSEPALEDGDGMLPSDYSAATSSFRRTPSASHSPTT